ncbi:hypothetical protein [Streptomyces sp. NBC_00654]|uniref:hypothetical protein n=1 Tax=Streptomyces sp. NBC_00654 TaxID=2975799 RepID=UPI00225165D1|nr:hypothetical protein [Streptomyces sp. NBC_00654]
MLLKELLRQRGKGLVGHLYAHRGRDGGASLKELVLNLRSELAQAARLGVLGGRLGVEVLGYTFQGP